MKFKLILIAFIFIFLIAGVSAIRYETESFRYAVLNADGSATLTNTPITGVNVKGYVCASANCATIQGDLYSGSVLSTSSDTITLDFPTNLQSSFGYGIIIYKAGYIPYEVTANYFGTNSNDPVGPVTRYLAQQQACLANITSMSVSNTSSAIVVAGSVAAPTNAGGLVTYSPPELQSFYTTNVDLSVNVSGAENHTQSSSTDIVFSANNAFSFTVPISTNGNYTVSVTSNPNDAKCISSSAVQSLRSTSIFINSSAFVPPSNNTNSSNSTVSLIIVSPQNINYTNNSILINISAVNASNVWYSINGNTNQTYTSPFVFNFPNGTNTFFAYGNNSQGGFMSTSVSFGVNLNGSSNSTNSTNSTASGPIYLTVNSPQSIQYNTSTIIVNITAINASNVWYAFEDTISNITYGNITYNDAEYWGLYDSNWTFWAYANNTNNSTYVSFPFSVNTSVPSTPCTSNCGGNGGSGGGGSSKKAVKTIATKSLSNDGDEKPTIFLEEEVNEPETFAKKSFSLSVMDWVIILLIIMSLILLALILILFSSRRD